eukprot:TRINITY_DN1544_c0_g3_i1.p1 TRINITY_DN1544_c0_g3~~TRINITY_DN1544_c0_g3_i1.p1  ORF type:complete len:185 (-),score=9.07 TRINITY_DN1544_c0_g3_i1:208-702(-)
MEELRKAYGELFGSEEGQVISEYRLPFKSIFVSPKCYIYYRRLYEGYGDNYEFHKDGKYEILKPRWKGVRRADKVVKDKSLVSMVATGRASTEILHNLYYESSLPYALTVGTYKEIIKHPDEDVYILCNRMVRSSTDAIGKRIAILNRFVIKRYNAKENTITEL